VIHKLSMGTKVITLLLVHIRRMVANFHAVKRAALVGRVRRLGLAARNCGAIAIQVFVGSPRTDWPHENLGPPCARNVRRFGLLF